MRVILLSAMAFALVGNAAVARAADADGRLESRLESRIAHDARLKGQDVKVDVDNGVAKLTGKVATEADRARAERLARAPGIVRVVDDLAIDTGATKERIEHNAERQKDQIDENARRDKERVDEQSKRATERVDENARAAEASPAEGAPVDRRSGNAGEELNDTWITTKVKSQFVGVDALKGSDISVTTTRDGVVTLTGTVPNEVARDRAVEIARTTKGVTRVVDETKMRR